MGALTNKITSYSHWKGISFDEQTFTSTPTRTGSKTPYTVMSDANFVQDGTNVPTIVRGPISTQKAYRFTLNSNTSPLTTSRLYYGSPTSGQIGGSDDIRRAYWDGGNFDRVYGIWVKTPEASNNPNGLINIHRILGGSNGSTLLPGVAVGKLADGSAGFSIAAQDLGASAPQIQNINQYGNSTDGFANIEFNTWYFVAWRKRLTITDTNPTINTTVNGTLTYDIYINGRLTRTVTVTSFPWYNVNMIEFGRTSAAFGLNSFDMANWFASDWSDIGEQGLKDIYNSGIESVNITEQPMSASNAEIIDPLISTSVNFTQTTLTADIDILMPTIVVVANNSVNVTTFLTSSAEFPSNYLVVASQNINFIVTEILTATTTIADNITISTGSNASYSAQEMIANALMVESRVSENPFIASATMPGGNATIPQNYYNLVKQINPYVYINNGATSPVNNGYQSGTFVKGSGLLTLQDGGLPLNIIAEGKSWKGGTGSNTESWMSFEPTNFADSFNSLVGTGAFAYEVWVKPLAFPSASQNNSTTDVSYTILRSDKLQLNLEDAYTSNPRYISLIINNTLSGNTEIRYPLDSAPLTLNTWNHIVINVYQSGINTNERLVQLWINGQIIINQNISFTAYTDTTAKANRILGGRATSLQYIPDMFFDELAIYKSANATTPALTNGQIIQHNNFINNTSPNFTHNATPLTANAESGNHLSPTNSNVTISADPATANILFVMPVSNIQRVINYSSSPMTASAFNTDAIAYWGRTIYANSMIASAFKPESYFLNNSYYNYVQTNITPYRYVNFDTSNVYADFGSDNDYSVIPTSIGGSIVNPDFAINGKSALTNGISYITDGVILKESEYNDNWGTGNASWHSSFWMQRALDDNSTGLRVLWNLNGKNDDQHVVLYHYQNKLHLQINDQSGPAITITTANNINPFDFNQHHFVIRNHHNNNNNHLYLYVDGVLVADQNINTYNVTTINNPIHVGPNDENNNFPRLSVGCLITTFANTALPVQPTNTKIIIDEIYWDKNDINQTAVTNLYNAMPGKNNKVISVEPFIASDEFLMPTITFSSNIFAAPKTANSELTDPTLYIERVVSLSADPMTASAEMAEASGFVPVNINADVMTANATFSFGLAEVTIPGSTMYASAIFKTENLNIKTTRIVSDDGFTSTITWYPDAIVTPWVAYLRATDVNAILPTREVI